MNMEGIKVINMKNMIIDYYKEYELYITPQQIIVRERGDYTKEGLEAHLIRFTNIEDAYRWIDEK